jgi:CRISPR-associated endonuclease/helicase Cas3
VQRFGLAARWGGEATVVVADLRLAGKKTAPYDESALEAARGALAQLTDVAPIHLERFEEAHPNLLPSLYPYDPKHLLLRHELDDIFDTTPDLSGADVDISRFIRTGEERDCHVFWANVSANAEPPKDLLPARQALCSVPFLKAQAWLCGDKNGAKLRKGMRAWVWDWLDGRWRWAERRDCWPGQTLLVAAECGGYDELRGWSPDANGPVASVPEAAAAEDTADNAQDDETLAAYPWRTIATHCREVGAEARTIAGLLAPALADVFDLAGRWHDAGKAHGAFQGSISKQRDGTRPDRQDLAKAPRSAWLRGNGLYPMPDGTRRPGFRHELASALALFAVLRRHRPDHPALLGPWVELLRESGYEPDLAPAVATKPTPLEQEVLGLGAQDFDLLAYLVCSHHGKVRMTWHACPADQSSGDERLRIRGIRDGDALPALPLTGVGGALQVSPVSALELAPSAAGLDARTGRGWTERCLDLLKAHGPFRLAWLEACLRAADMRASRTTTSDPLLSREGLAP